MEVLYIFVAVAVLIMILTALFEERKRPKCPNCGNDHLAVRKSVFDAEANCKLHGNFDARWSPIKWIHPRCKSL